jgi:hypothetical protein
VVVAGVVLLGRVGGGVEVDGEEAPTALGAIRSVAAMVTKKNSTISERGTQGEKRERGRERERERESRMPERTAGDLLDSTKSESAGRYVYCYVMSSTCCCHDNQDTHQPFSLSKSPMEVSGPFFFFFFGTVRNTTMNDNPELSY